MQLLLDSHALIWLLRGDSELSDKAKKAITDQDNDRFVSPASLWEIAIKVQLGKIHFSFPFSEFATLIAFNNFQWLPVEFLHTEVISSLPLHHRDPFDRMLIAQALSDKLTVVTKDPNFPLYGIETLW